MKQTKLAKTSILSVGVTSSSKSDIINSVEKYLIGKTTSKPLTIFTPNPEQIVMAQKDKKFCSLLNSADIALSDGEGIVWASKIVHSSKIIDHRNFIRERIPGVEFMEDLVELAADKGYVVGLIGGRQGVADAALTKLKSKYPQLKGWAEDGPEIQIQNSKFKIQNKTEEKYFKELMSLIVDRHTKIVFIGLGAPKQEFFIEELSSKIIDHRSKKKKSMNFKLRTSNSLIIMTVGGAFDIISGELPRAPQLLVDLKLEWLWRLILQPKRIFRQFNLLKFIILTLRARL